MIGPLNHIGTNYGKMYSNYANKCPFSIPSENWIYATVNEWASAVTNEINIHCLNGKIGSFCKYHDRIF